MDIKDKMLVGSANLANLSRVGTLTIHNVKCVVIPIEENDIYIKTKEDGRTLSHACINVLVRENKDGVDSYGNTHYMKLGLSKETRERGAKEMVDRINATYLGNLKAMDIPSGNQAQTIQPPVVSDEQIQDEALPF